MRLHLASELITPLQQYPGLHMMGVGELIKQGAAGDAVGAVKGGQVLGQGIGVA